ncbi:hypothetical protein DFH07DRAFT_970020 [Mycena maculata]|uniref:Uncharacterized protein n=1 Tax=Mycena maculata TaxID=230809 RepID=A0AAD7MQ47_9AGAR|nr:hypothetical protein DFH07DRAFT_970020 [Mycena maculata]
MADNNVLAATNLDVNDMVPDDVNPDHDRRYWCLPPMRNEKSKDRHGAYPLYLVTRGRQVGVWHNWTVVKAMTTGYPLAACAGPRSPHPGSMRAAPSAGPRCGSARPTFAEPSVGLRSDSAPLPSASRPTKEKTVRAAGTTAAPTSDRTQTLRTDMGRPAKGKKFSSSMRSEERLLGSVSSTSSVTASDAVPRTARYYAIWGGGKVFTDHKEAMATLLREEERGVSAQMLSTRRRAEAEAYSQPAIWI